MKILCTGLSRTGTSSLHHALQALGFSSLHYDTERLNPVLESQETPEPGAFRVYDDVDAVSDLPAAWFYPQLLKAYPKLKCIHTLREENAWWRSIEAHFNVRHPVADEQTDPFRWRLRHRVYGSARATESLYRQAFRTHNQRVLATIPPQQLLVMDIIGGDGWDQLCPFLEVPRPPTPFPHQNSKREFDNWQERLQQTRADLKVVPDDARFILLDEDQLRTQLAAPGRAIPFLCHDGDYWGPPPDDQTAIEQFNQLRNAAHYVVVAWPAFWWLDHYHRFHHYLRTQFNCLLETERVLVFDLHPQRHRRPATA